MNVDRSVWDKLAPVVVLLLFIVGLLAIAVWYLPLIRHNERIRTEVLRLESRIQQEEVRAKQLRSAIDALRFDPKAIERVSRDQLGYAKPGETVIRFRAATMTNGLPRP